MTENVVEILDDGTFMFQCPHCNGTVLVKRRDVRCRIFRHATFKHNARPISPHAPQAMCEKYVRQGVVYGCARPMLFVFGDSANNRPHTVKPCGYI